ncbi:unnamed protein product [Hymenolepis diminuta]|uniref:Fructose-1,6-bisphosphatase isozyme 2 n=3 Tax=Hymenolepis diminuta TaxID=6216 RepID=A0A0R3SE74_HYMDI|nr:unnamed protein product [Hymenolepis diminuta]VUZ39802.1 unnamed protein product [Hymenolepis diminuta]
MCDDKITTNCMTLTRFIINEQMKYPKASGEMTQLMNGIQTAVKAISNAVRKAGIAELYGFTGKSNIQGEDVKKLDVISNELFINMMIASYTTCMLVSEENDDPIIVEHKQQGKYIVAFDPMDGSSNIDCLGSVGSIFTVFRRMRRDYSPVDPTEALQSGRDVVAAGYAIYGSSTMIVLSLGSGVYGFMLDPCLGEFILTHTNITIPKRGSIFSVNEGNASYWSKGVLNYLQEKKFPKNGKPYSARYQGSMAGDMHRTLLYGGIFMYPALCNAPEGKLRLLYECIPMAYLVEQAGGKAMAREGLDILDIKPTHIHQRSPIYLGSAEDVDEAIKFISETD